jgi:hypothetical protein
MPLSSPFPQVTELSTISTAAAGPVRLDRADTDLLLASGSIFCGTTGNNPGVHSDVSNVSLENQGSTTAGSREIGVLPDITMTGAPSHPNFASVSLQR